MAMGLGSRLGKFAVSCGLVVLSGSGFFLAESAAAIASSTPGVISGKLVECGPGAKLPRQTAASPAMVILTSQDRTYSSELIAFSKTLPWTGSFTFTVRPGEYNVISSLQGMVKSVSVKSNSRHLVNFGLPICAT